LRAGQIPFRRSIQLKFALSYIGVIVAVLALLNTYPVIVSQDLVFRSKENSLQSQASVIANTLAMTETLSPQTVGEYVDSLPQDPGTRVMVTDSAGLVLADTAVGAENGEGRYALYGEVVKALGGQDVFRVVYHNETFFGRAASPVIYRGMIIGAVYVYEADADQGRLLTDIQSNLRSISLVVLVITLMMSAVFSKALTGRISRILRGIRGVREGEYTHRVEVKGKDELAQLAVEFNQLTGRLETTEEVRRRFVSDASHELKTPLASIRLLTDSILQTEGMDMETVKDFVSDIGEEADRLTRISEKLLTLTRLDAGVTVETVPVDLGGVVRRVEHMLTPLAAESKVELSLELQENCLVLATDDDLYRVVFNLIENAIKYNKPAGRVMVELVGAGDLVTLTVADTGVGIPESELGKVFDRFYRVDKARSRAAGGTGLGLSIVKDTVRQHGGAVTVERRESEGTLFTVAFPRYEKGEEAP